ncbi:MAG: hypothetical protein U9Q81_16175 [Pseudomonadota bacterium]|nr:hypothetical protein [Pseudomonadota bacterium]
MFDYIIGLVIVVVILLVPQIRKAALRLLGLTAIAGIAVAGIGLPIWGLYEAKSWLISPTPVVEAPEDEALGNAQSANTLTAEQEEGQRRLEGEREQQAEEQRLIEEEQFRIAGLAETARSVVARERTYAAVAASSPQLPGVDQVSVDLIRIRIPSWRSNELAEREKGLIRVWLHSIGLTPEETKSIYTANGWGSVYDLWRKETTTATKPTPDTQVPVASVPEQSPPPGPDPESEPEAQPEPRPEPRQAARRTFPQTRAVAPRSEPRRESTARRRPAPEREVGPFGY